MDRCLRLFLFLFFITLPTHSPITLKYLNPARYRRKSQCTAQRGLDAYVRCEAVHHWPPEASNCHKPMSSDRLLRRLLKRQV